MRHYLMLLFVQTALPLCGQFTGLATDRHGSQLLFSTPQILRGSRLLEDSGPVRLYRWGPGQIAEAADAPVPVVLTGARVGRSAGRAQLSSDGSVEAFLLAYDCAPFEAENQDACDGVPGSRLVVRGRYSWELPVWGGFLSSSGRYLVTHPLGSRVTVRDFATGEVHSLPDDTYGLQLRNRIVTDSGSVLVASDGLGGRRLAIFGAGRIQSVPVRGFAADAQISPDGRTLVYLSRSSPDGYRWIAQQLLSGQETVFAEGAGAAPAVLSLSHDGQVLLLQYPQDSALSSGRLRLVKTDGSGSQPVIPPDNGAAMDAVLSVAGDALFVATDRDRCSGRAPARKRSRIGRTSWNGHPICEPQPYRARYGWHVVPTYACRMWAAAPACGRNRPPYLHSTDFPFI